MTALTHDVAPSERGQLGAHPGRRPEARMSAEAKIVQDAYRLGCEVTLDTVVHLLEQAMDLAHARELLAQRLGVASMEEVANAA